MPTLLELRDQVQRILAEAVGPLELRPEGDITFRHGSARVFVDCTEQEFDNDSRRTLVNVAAPVLFNVPASPALFEYIATNSDNWLFGHLSAARDDETGGVNVLMTHRLLGDYLDAEELLSAVIGIVMTAEDLDDELKARFGGERMHED
jgi:hypothetical protein